MAGAVSMDSGVETDDKLTLGLSMDVDYVRVYRAWFMRKPQNEPLLTHRRGSQETKHRLRPSGPPYGRLHRAVSSSHQLTSKPILSDRHEQLCRSVLKPEYRECPVSCKDPVLIIFLDYIRASAQLRLAKEYAGRSVLDGVNRLHGFDDQC
jgi:hypothetical protein